MKKLFLFIILTSFCGGIFAQNDSVPVINTAFEPGEYLKYKVKYGLINGGVAEMKIELEQVGFDWYYHVKAVARTTGAVSMFARVSDRYESYIELPTGLPLQAIRDINENNYRRYNEVIFVRDEKKVISLKSGEHNVPDGILDILSAFYFARRVIFDKPLKKNQVINLTTYFDDNIFNLKIRYKKTEKIKTKVGKLNCLKFSPVVDGKTFEKEKDLEFWFSDDGNFIPVKIRFKVGISTVKADLIQYKNLKHVLGKPYTR